MLLEHFRNRTVLGEGISGRVFKAEYQKKDFGSFEENVPKFQVALKIVPKPRVSQQELLTLSKLHHPNIVRYIHSFDHIQDGFTVRDCIEF